ncbi:MULTISPECIES: hypothetical protein [Neptuniibacter]|mgnify:FL=1|jgi:hypothetical protein|uniref:PA4570 family protein n=1 Tax=Neptuniibacter TaxID=459520 RepID=UPI00082D9F70|nr:MULTISPECIES: hypothetical protein [Neptuniibacter]MDO6514194.1 hypothetical protein [Neptuniibacter sp. 2_MG-2023]MDO6592683.1 hypothetical protein [Neptuniibacter sp. 1_MG-2023]
MTYVIDAWFERSNPYLRVIHRSTGIPIVHWQGSSLMRKLENGSICVEDFAESPSQELVKELFLLDCLEQKGEV